MEQISLADVRHLEAAEGWLGLGDHASAGEELDQITPALQAKPAVLELRWAVCATGGRWEGALEAATNLTRLLPEHEGAWVHRSFALHELKRTEEARDNLVSVLEKFPKCAVLRYNLGCYECQLGNLAAAREWLKQAFALPGGAELRAAADSDPDLTPLWGSLGAL